MAPAAATMGTGTTMGTDGGEPRPSTGTLSPAALLQLMWLASPALPVGGFSYSEGLEAAVESGRVATEAQARAWLLDQLQLVLARSELAVAAQAFAAWADDDLDRVDTLNQWVLRTRESSEQRQQTMQMGRSLAEWLKNQPLGGADGDAATDTRVARLAALAPAPSWPIAFALAAWRTGAPLEAALHSMAFGWAENMVQAALKAVPLGQSAGQRVLAALCAQIPAAVRQASSLHDGERQAHSPMLAILSALHETQYSRLFRS
jgi:urease accessory protein